MACAGKGMAHTLEKEYDVIMPDAREHGKSSVPDYGYRYEDHANDVAVANNSTKVTIVFKNIPTDIDPKDNETGTEQSLEKLAHYVEEN